LMCVGFSRSSTLKLQLKPNGSSREIGASVIECQTPPWHSSPGVMLTGGCPRRARAPRPQPSAGEFAVCGWHVHLRLLLTAHCGYFFVQSTLTESPQPKAGAMGSWVMLRAQGAVWGSVVYPSQFFRGRCGSGRCLCWYKAGPSSIPLRSAFTCGSCSIKWPVRGTRAGVPVT
jgi:hypothetical protein